MKTNTLRYKLILWLVNKLGGIKIKFIYTGDRGKEEIYFADWNFYPHEAFIIDWTNKEIRKP